MSRNRARGTAWESAIARCFQAYGWPSAERRALAGKNDRGDITGVPSTVISAKDWVHPELGTWTTEMLQQKARDRARFGAVWFKRKGKASPLDGYVLMPGREFLVLLAAAHGLEDTP